MSDDLERLILHNAQVATMRGVAGGDPYGLIPSGAIVVHGESIAWVGPAGELPQEFNSGAKHIDAGGRVVTPGLVDCHTHLVFAGNRAGEFEQRLGGASYSAIAKAGGGILATVRATREASVEDLVRSGRKRVERLQRDGVTTVEIKSGYGLDTASEVRMLEAARAIGERCAADVVTSFLGAHALPPEHANDRAAFIRLVCEDMLPEVARLGLADAVDGFAEGIGFTVGEMAQVFEAASRLGLPVKLHAEQLSNLGGAAMAAGYGALSADHLEYLDAAGVEALARAGTVAVLLPGAFYYLGETRKPPVAALQAADVPIALATDLNPGSSPVCSLLAAMNMACVLFGLTPAAALAGVTVNGARALGLKDRGIVASGMLADLALWDVDSPGELAYALGADACIAVFKRGAQAYSNPAFETGAP